MISMDEEDVIRLKSIQFNKYSDVVYSVSLQRLDDDYGLIYSAVIAIASNRRIISEDDFIKVTKFAESLATEKMGECGWHSVSVSRL